MNSLKFLFLASLFAFLSGQAQAQEAKPAEKCVLQIELNQYSRVVEKIIDFEKVVELLKDKGFQIKPRYGGTGDQAIYNARSNFRLLMDLHLESYYRHEDEASAEIKISLLDENRRQLFFRGNKGRARCVRWLGWSNYRASDWTDAYSDWKNRCDDARSSATSFVAKKIVAYVKEHLKDLPDCSAAQGLAAERAK